jgi:predicted RecB family nuclease
MRSTRNYSIKALARILKFQWRDNTASSAASVEWFDQRVTTGDPAIRQRIIDYNSDEHDVDGLGATGCSCYNVP